MPSSKTNGSLRRTLWQRWRRGFVTLASAYYLGVMPFTLGIDLLGNFKEWPVLLFVIGVPYFCIWIIGAPLLASYLGLEVDPRREQARTANALLVDELIALAGINWEGHYLSEVDRLTREDKLEQAKKLYHEQAGVTWDQAHAALFDWPTTLVTKKLELLRSHLSHGQKESR